MFEILKNTLMTALSGLVGAACSLPTNTAISTSEYLVDDHKSVSLINFHHNDYSNDYDLVIFINNE